MKTLFRLAITAVLALMMLTGTVHAQTKHKFSGFLEDYSQLRPDPERPGVFVDLPQRLDRKTYPKVMINEIEVFYAPDSKYKGISPKKLLAITETFREYLIETLGERRTIVNKLGEGVVVFNLAITNVHARRPKRSALNVLPPVAITTGVKKAAGTDYWLTNAEFEAEAIDGQTYRQLGAIVGTRLGKEDKVSKEEKDTSWKDIEAEFKRFADRLRRRFDEADARMKDH